jgi:site-specific DNA recombinase
MGRLTLNVLLSFAQFEREVIGERVRDKIAASKRKGMWVGGPVPLGYASVGKKLVVVPSEAEIVRTIFKRYHELGSVGALVQDLDRRGIRTKRREGAKGSLAGGARFGVGALAYLLKNRIYIGEVAYRGQSHCGEHEAIVERPVFEAAQSKLAGNAVVRQLRLKNSPALLTGHIFDDRGNRMSPTHANKLGVRYRYYVSQALIQNRKAEVGSVARVPAPEIETLVLDGIRKHLAASEEPPTNIADRDLIERHIERVVVKPQAVEVHLLPESEARVQAGMRDIGDADQDQTSTTAITLPWTAPSFSAVKGIIHAPSVAPAMKPETRETLLGAIAKARVWIEDIRLGRVASLAEIAGRECQGERYIRMLLPLAFVSPRIVAVIAEGRAAANLTVSSLVRALPYSWAEQERSIGLFQ